MRRGIFHIEINQKLQQQKNNNDNGNKTYFTRVGLI